MCGLWAVFDVGCYIHVGVSDMAPKCDRIAAGATDYAGTQQLVLG